MRVLLLLGILALPLTLLTAQSGDPGVILGHYDGAGAIVAASSFLGANFTFVDNGAVICSDADHDGRYETGTGGLCARWDQLVASPDGYGVGIRDDAVGSKVAFQVCIDANGDGICGGGVGGAGGVGIPLSPAGGGCRDVILFSHGSDGSYHNPLLVPTAFRDYAQQCASGASFPGVVVIVCAGIHGFGSPSSHTHQVSSGTVFSAPTTDLDHGDFCGAPTAAKAYELH